MSGCRKRRCLVERDIFKVGFRMGVSFERRVELSEAEMGVGNEKLNVIWAFRETMARDSSDPSGNQVNEVFKASIEKWVHNRLLSGR